MLLLSTAARVAGLLWPEFREHDGVIVLASATVRPLSEWNGTVTEYERFYGHTHVQDLFTWRVPMVHDPEWDAEVPDAASPEFAAVWDLARKVGAMWLAKLAADFPEYRFRVYVTKLSDPIVHFHRVRDGERPWDHGRRGARPGRRRHAGGVRHRGARDRRRRGPTCSLSSRSVPVADPANRCS